ncbi:amino acid-binding protein [Nocardia nova]|uniref:amino acid-binding protein n=1 Tax=Nocardia nova TaxID=37330 RepID=UPI00340A7D66
MKLAAILPVELVLHMLVMYYELPFAVTVLILAVTATLIAGWVVEPSAIRLLSRWLHGPALRARDRVRHAAMLWRIRVRLRDRPGQLEALAGHLADIGANILTVHVHRVESGALDELIIATASDISGSDLRAAVSRSGGEEIRIWPATAMALIDGQNKALALAARVVADPDELPLAVAELLAAQYLSDGIVGGIPPAEVLTMEVAPGDEICCVRPGEPFTPAEIARAHRLREVARSLVNRRG